MLAYYDVMLQHLFALGTHLEASARREGPSRSGRFLQAASVVDGLIEITRTQAFGTVENVHADAAPTVFDGRSEAIDLEGD